MKRVMAVVVLTVALLYANFVYGQGTLANATLQGRVLDQSGAVIPGATLELVELNKGSRSTAVSDSSGYYSFAQIPYGSYSLTAKMAGFGDTTVSPINVTAREVASVDVSLKPGTLVQTVEVSASALRLESQTSDVGQDLVTTIVTTMPIAHRNVIELVGLVPGVLQNRTEGGSTMNTQSATATWGRSNFTIGGGMRNTSSFLIDGVDATHSFSPGGGNAMVFISPDSVEEFRLHLFDSPADLPRGSGVLSLVSKSGTNAIHGDVFYTQQNSALNATDFFTNQAGQPKPPLIRHEFGGSVGGPVVIPKIYNGRNKTFFFFDYDEIRQPLTQTFQTRVPTADELNGNFSGIYATDGSPVTIYNPLDTYVDPGTGKTLRRPFPNNTIPSSAIDQFAKNLTSFFPKSNVPGGIKTAAGLPTQTNNFFVNSGSQFVFRDENVRVDEQLRDDLRFMFHTVHNPAPLKCANPYGNLASPTNCLTQTPTFTSGTINWMITPHVILTQSGAWQNAPFFFNNVGTESGKEFDLASLGGPYSQGSPFLNLLLSRFGFRAFPSFSIGGYGGLGSATVHGGEDTGGTQTDLTWTRGSHTLKFGFQFYNRSAIFAFPTSTAGGFTATNLTTSGQFTNGPDPLLPDKDTGNALADLELGILGGGVVNLPSLERTYRDTYYAWYAQDDWKVTPKLTLNLGLRYDFDLSFREAHENTAVFNANVPNPIGNYIGPNTGGVTLNQTLGRTVAGGYVFAGSSLIGGSKRPAGQDFKDLSPRIGFAYAPTPKWVFRGSFGRIYFHGINGVTDNGNCPSCTGVTPLIQSLDGIHPNPAVALANPFPSGFNEPTGNKLGLLTGVGLPLTETGAAFPVTPFAYQVSGGFQRELPLNTRLSIQYVGSRGRHLACPNDACNDQIPISTVQKFGAHIDDLVPNPFYGIITNSSSILSQPTVQQWRLLMNWPQFTGGSLHMPAAQNQKGFPLFDTQYPFKSSWNALLLSYEKRFSGGLEVLVAYTWSKTISNADAFESWMAPTPFYQNIYEVEKEKSLSSEDVPQRLVISHVYELPFGKGKHFASQVPGVVDKVIGGWQLGGNLILASGTPLFFSVTPNNSNTQSGGLYPNLVKTPTMTGGSRGQKVEQWFDTTAFAAPAPFTYGNASRTVGSVRSDGIKNYDMTLAKWFPIVADRFKMQLRMDAFNLFNRTQFGFPNTTLGSPSFGTVSSVASAPRFIQIGARLQW